MIIYILINHRRRLLLTHEWLTMLWHAMPWELYVLRVSLILVLIDERRLGVEWKNWIIMELGEHRWVINVVNLWVLYAIHEILKGDGLPLKIGPKLLFW